MLDIPNVNYDLSSEYGFPIIGETPDMTLEALDSLGISLEEARARWTKDLKKLFDTRTNKGVTVGELMSFWFEVNDEINAIKDKIEGTTMV